MSNDDGGTARTSYLEGETPLTAVPSEAAIYRRAESRGLRVETRTSKRQGARYTLIDAASGVVVRKELDVEELVDVLAVY
jgi:hypothetical protein